jgi:hypothetical protein
MSMNGRKITLKGWQRLTIGLMLWQKSLSDIRSFRSKAKQPKPQTFENIYSRCDEIPLYNFLKGYLDKDFTGLLKSPGKLPEGYESVWDNIFLEYLDLSDDPELNSFRELSNKIITLSALLSTINSAIDLLSRKREASVISALSVHGFTVNTSGNADDYYISLEQIRSSIKGLQLDLLISQEQMKKLVKSHDTVKINRKYFDKLIQLVSKYQGFQVNIRKITVTEFMATITLLKEKKNVVTENI